MRWIALALGLVALGAVLAALFLPVLMIPAAPAAAAAGTAAPQAATTETATETPTATETTAAAAPPDKGQAALLAEIRALLPQRLDRLTTFADARHDATGFTFVFLFPFLKIEVDPAQLAAILKAKAESGFCTDPYVQRIFGFGERVDLIFHSADGFTVYQQALTAPDCA